MFASLSHLVRTSFVGVERLGRTLAEEMSHHTDYCPEYVNGWPSILIMTFLSLRPRLYALVGRRMVVAASLRCLPIAALMCYVAMVLNAPFLGS